MGRAVALICAAAVCFIIFAGLVFMRLLGLL